VSARILKQLKIDGATRAKLTRDYERFSRAMPLEVEDYVRERYRLDLSSEYGGLPIKNPFGKASGQLSLNAAQARRDAREGLGFVVLKTIIAEDAEGAQSMSAWAIHETKMLLERITGADRTSGWTVTWKGRGWYDTFEKYLEFYREALLIGQPFAMPVVPSCKYHLPTIAENDWKVGEYEYTSARLLEVWRNSYLNERAMPLEKDFSPTLAGSDRAAQKETILRWLGSVGGLIKGSAGAHPVSLGIKLFNAVFEDEFQLEMLRAVSGLEKDAAPDYLVYANRLFDPGREFDGVRGVAYGGPDLSERNLKVLSRLRYFEQSGGAAPSRLPISATGNIESGQTAAEYLLRGASSFQIHTFFQLPSGEYRMQIGGKTRRALCELYFHPEKGLIAWLLHLRALYGWAEDWNVKRMADFCADPANRIFADEHAVVA
jgi:hypothetical protein